MEVFETGKTFPPLSERERLDKYRENAQLYNTDFNAINNVWERLCNHTGTTTPPMVYLNYYKLIATKIADLLWAEEPTLRGSDEIAETADEIDLITKCYISTLDCVRYGTGVFLVTTKNGRGYIRNVNPATWYPIVSDQDCHEITGHVLAWVVNSADDRSYLEVQKHYKGYYICEKYEYHSGLRKNHYDFHELQESAYGVIGRKLSEERVYTRLNDFAVIPIQVQLATDSVYASDEYTPIKSILDELMEKMSLAASILDRHSNPILTGPPQVLDRKKDRQGRENAVFDKNKYFPTVGIETDFKYITWDAQLTALQGHITMLLQQLAILTEMGPTMTGEYNVGNLSGRALQMLYISPLSKAQRYKKQYNKTIRKVLSLVASLNGSRISEKDVSIEFKDGLPGDYAEDCNAESIRINSGTSTPIISAARLDGISVEQATDMLQQGAKTQGLDE